VKNNPLYIPTPFSKDLKVKDVIELSIEYNNIIEAIRLYKIDLSRLPVTALDNINKIKFVVNI
jgi:hypothetical protein